MYDETVVSINEAPQLENVLLFDPPYRRISKIYDMEPFDEPVHRGVYISMSAPDSAKEMNGLGIYYWDSRKGWQFIPGSYDSLKHTIKTRVTSLEKFTIAQDTVPPVLIPAQSLQNGILKSQKGFLSFVVKDEMSGIRRESQIEVLVDGKWHLFEYDPEENVVALKLPRGRSSPSSVEITVTDNMGNRVIRHFNAL
jgi:hypothetical protein